MDDQIQVQIKFTIDNYTDALYFPIEDWPVDEKTIQAEKQARYDNHLAALEEAQNAEPIPDEEAIIDTEEQLAKIEADLETLLEAKERLTDKKQELQTKVEAADVPVDAIEVK